ncbi:MAG: hypothetical protein AB8B79_15220 [Granulosicoccus sp.]
MADRPGSSSRYTQSSNLLVHLLRKFASLVLGVWAVLVLSGCSDSILCVGGKVPQFDTIELTPAVLNQEYTHVIRASVRNSVSDDQYRYSFSLIGDLPEGVTSRQDDRRYIFEGTPTSLGEFSLQLTVTLDEENNFFNTVSVNDLCRRSETVSYQLTITTM